MKFDLKQTVEVAVNNDTAVGKIVSYRIKNRGIGRNPLIEYKVKLYGKYFWIAESAIIGQHQPKPQPSEAQWDKILERAETAKKDFKIQSALKHFALTESQINTLKEITNAN